MLPVLHRPAAEGKEKQRSKEGRRDRSHVRPFHGEKCNRHRDKSRSWEHLGQVLESSEGALTKEEEAEPALPPENADEEVVRTYLQKLCDGDPQKLAALAGMNHETIADDLQEPAEMSLTDAIIEGCRATLGQRLPRLLTLCQVKEAAVVPVDVSTPEKVVPESNPAAEDPQIPVNPPKVPKLVAPYRYAATLQCLQATAFTIAQHQHLCQGEPETCKDCR